jgi:hypothetical protein
MDSKSINEYGCSYGLCVCYVHWRVMASAENPEVRHEQSCAQWLVVVQYRIA